MPLVNRAAASRQLWAFSFSFGRYNFLFLLRTNKFNWRKLQRGVITWFLKTGRVKNKFCSKSASVKYEGKDPIWKTLPRYPGWFVEQCRLRGEKTKPVVLKDDRLINWCPFQLVLCQLMLAPLQRSCNLGARCEAFLFHLVPQHLQKPYTSHLKEKPSGGKKRPGKGGKQVS